MFLSQAFLGPPLSADFVFGMFPSTIDTVEATVDVFNLLFWPFFLVAQRSVICLHKDQID